jgi:hypothetical protein
MSVTPFSGNSILSDLEPAVQTAGYGDTLAGLGGASNFGSSKPWIWNWIRIGIWIRIRNLEKMLNPDPDPQPWFSLTWSRPSRLRGMVTHLLGWPGQLSACSSDSIAPFVFFSFFTSASTAFFLVQCCQLLTRYFDRVLQKI